MNSQSSSSQRLSNIFFLSILVAAGIYGVAIVIESLSAGELVPGLITLAIVTFAVAATIILHIPNYFGSNFSGSTISLLAIAVSIFGLLLTVPNAASFADLPDSMLNSSGVQNLRTVSYIGAVSFGLALIINVVAAFVVPRQGAST